MRLSEAMLLGDSMRERTNEVYLVKQWGRYCGCAIGGALLAAGVGRVIGENNHQAIGRVFPWLLDRCNPKETWEVVIAFTRGKNPSFEKVLKGKCTFEQLVDYVRSVEPDCGTCCSFSCTCQRTIEPELEVAEAVSVR